MAALSLLLVNDHFLKKTFGSWFTGKLSDFAGLIVFPVFIYCAASIFRRKSVTKFSLLQLSIFSVTFFWFAAMKTIPEAAAATEQLAEVFIANATIVVDPSDTAALLVLPLAWHILSKPQVLISRRVFHVSILFVAMFGTVATSEDHKQQVDLVKDPHSGIVTFEKKSEYQALYQTQTCTSSKNMCYRITEKEVQEYTENSGGWETIWAVPLDSDNSWKELGVTPADSRNLVDIEVNDQGVIYVAVDTLPLPIKRSADGTWNVPSANFRTNYSLLLTSAVLGAGLAAAAFKMKRFLFVLPLMISGAAVSYYGIDVGRFLGFLIGGIVLLLLACLVTLLVGATFSTAGKDTLKRTARFLAAILSGSIVCVPHCAWMFTGWGNHQQARVLTTILIVLAVGFARWLTPKRLPN